MRFEMLAKGAQIAAIGAFVISLIWFGIWFCDRIDDHNRMLSNQKSQVEMWYDVICGCI